MSSEAVVDILITDSAGKPLESQQQAELVAGQGVVGDRYFLKTGTFSEKLAGLPDAELTLIEREEIDTFNEKTKLGYSYADFRRNIVTQGVRLNDLVGKTFFVGDVELEGIRLCEPCAHLANLLSNEIMQHMVHKTGLRARVKSSGNITLQSPIRIAGTEE